MATTAKIFTFNVDGNEIAIRVSMSFDKEIFKWGATRNRFNVYISCNGLTLRTKFHDSVINHRNGKTNVNDEDLFDALHCILHDALTIMEIRDFGEYRDNFDGTYYEYRNCVSVLEKFTAMFGGDENVIIDILNIMDEEE